VRKLRGSSVIGGYHDFEITGSGVQVYPRLVAAPHRSQHARGEVKSDIPELDALLGGGLDRGTSTVLMGPAGTGKSTLTGLFLCAAAARGDAATLFSFDESTTNLLVRMTGLGVPLAEHVESGRVRIVPVDPAELTPGELSHRAVREVERGSRIVAIDSLNGYLNAMPGERFLSAHLHELLAFLGEKGVATILTLAQQGFFGTIDSPVNITYVADTVVLIRYFEALGEVRQALSVVKKRTGRHERSIRELRFGAEGIRVGEPLTAFQGVLSGNPTFVSGDLLGGDRDRAG
jgi:circadian clock protein KaiC